MTEELVLYTNPMSRGRIARWMLEEVGEPYRAEILEFAGSMNAPEYMAINPMGKVPTLRHGETIVTEAAAICAYLADVFPESGPRASARLALARALLPLAVLRRRTDRGRQHQQGAQRRRSNGARQDGRLRQPGAGALAALEDQLNRSEYIAGDRFTAADVYVGSQVGFGMMFGTMDKRPAFERYWALVGTRPAAQRAREIDDKLVAEQRKAG